MDYEAMLGLGISEDDQMRALADRLRGRERAADVFALSTVPQLAQAAQTEQGRLRDTASSVGALRKARAVMEAQSGREKAAQEARAAEGLLDRDAAAEKARLDRESREEIARLTREARGAGGGKKTAQQQKQAYLADTFFDGLGTLEALIKKGYEPTGLGGFKDKLTTQSDWTRFLASEEGQQWDSAASLVKEAALRTATGAAAPEGERKEYMKTLIPQPGEDPNSVAEKMARLKRFGTILAELGGATEEEAQANYDAAVEAAESLEVRGDGGMKPLEEMTEEELMAELQGG